MRDPTSRYSLDDSLPQRRHALSTTQVVLISLMKLSRAGIIIQLILQMLMECKLWALCPIKPEYIKGTQKQLLPSRVSD